MPGCSKFSPHSRGMLADGEESREAGRWLTLSFAIRGMEAMQAHLFCSLVTTPALALVIMLTASTRPRTAIRAVTLERARAMLCSGQQGVNRLLCVSLADVWDGLSPMSAAGSCERGKRPSRMRRLAQASSWAPRSVRPVREGQLPCSLNLARQRSPIAIPATDSAHLQLAPAAGDLVSWSCTLALVCAEG